MSYEVERPLKRSPSHPGALVKDLLKDRPETKSYIAGIIGISRNHLYDIMNEKCSVTPEMALRFGKLFGNGPELWINMQNAYDLHKASLNIDLDAIIPLVVE